MREQERRGTLFSPLPPVHRPCRPAAKSWGGLLRPAILRPARLVTPVLLADPLAVLLCVSLRFLRPIRLHRGQWPQRTQEAARSRPISRSDARVEQKGTGTKGNSVLSVASCSSSVSTGRKEPGALPHLAIFRPAPLVTSVLLAAPPRRSPFACLCVSCGQSVLVADNRRKERKKAQGGPRSAVVRLTSHLQQLCWLCQMEQERP